MNKVDFQHNQSAHCESGVVSNLLNFHGLKLSEPMVFGIGSGLFFAHLPFIKVNGIPGTSYRTIPGLIFKRACNSLGVKIHSETFSDPKKAMQELDKVLQTGKPVGMLTSVFYLPYLPKALRFHFNAHNLIVFGKRDQTYFVSDPVLDITTEIHEEDLKYARFAKGTLAPKGKMYYPVTVPVNFDLVAAIKKGIRKTTSDMLGVPFPFIGIKGEKYLAKKIASYPEKYGSHKASLFLGNIVRMQEEIGTGGAGFRFIFAAFLKEASDTLRNDELSSLAKEMTIIGNQWRDFAFTAGRICKERAQDGESYKSISELLVKIADEEMTFFKKLAAVRM